MSFSKSRFVEQVLLRINGGIINDESSVERVDIESYLPASINYALTASRNIELQSEGDRDISSLFYSYFYDLPLLKDTTMHNWRYFVKPKAIIAMYAGEGIRSVDDGCGNTFKPLTDNALKTINHYLKIFTSERFYKEFGDRVYVWGTDPLQEKINFTGIVDVDDLGDDDILPIMAGMEGKAIDICVEFFTGERHEPADRKSDKRDIN